MRPNTRSRHLALVVVLGALVWLGAAEPGTEAPTEVSASPEATAGDGDSAPTEEAQAVAEDPDAALDGREIYKRMLDNRYKSFVQTCEMVSGDRAGNEQETRMRMAYESQRGPDDEPLHGATLSKTLVRYTFPSELRHSGYLAIQNVGRPDDQFVYRSSSRRIQRVNLRKEAVFGTDFSFEDLFPREIEDATYERDIDTDWEGESVFVVTATPTPIAASEYSKFQTYIDKQRYIPLRSIYWNEENVLIKELSSPADRVEQHDHVWVPMESTMRNLREQSFTVLTIKTIEPNVKIRRREFDIRKLESR